MKKLFHFNIGSALRRALGIKPDSREEPQQEPAQAAKQKHPTDIAQSPAAVPLDSPVGSVTDEEAKKLLVWMIERDRYGVRGRALCTMLEVYASDAVDLCEGIQGYVLNAPNGESVVVEGRSGGLVGYSLETVLDGIRDMSHSDLIRQIDSARKEFDRMQQQELSTAMFWAALKMSDEEPPPATEFD